jgi:hypothetical protein
MCAGARSNAGEGQDRLTQHDGERGWTLMAAM